jgi:tetratricopeptide (TPR) repeat protein
MSKKSRAKNASRSSSSVAFLAQRGIPLAGGLVVLAALLAYHNSFSGPFLFDDPIAIADNPSIRHIGSAWSPPPAATTGGRPLLNLSYALNYASGGLDTRGYHAFNLLIHTLAGLTLFGVVRRTLLRPALAGLRRARPAGANPEAAIPLGLSPTEALLLALAVAVLWVVHPLQTEAVTYISQRAESLMGLFYLLTLYCFIRGACKGSQETGDRSQESEIEERRMESKDRRPQVEGDRARVGSFQFSTVRFLTPDFWLLLSIISCLLGAMSKEIIVTAPVMVMLYDRIFVAGSFREVGRRRWRYYLGLGSTWLLLAHLMTGLSKRDVGFDQGVSWWKYALTSCRAVVLYLRLAVWPHPLIFDRGADVVRNVSEALPYALALLALIGGVAVALRRWPAIGFAGAWIFVILAPTTSIVPVALQPIGEHRMYLPLAGAVSLVVLGLYGLLGRRSLILILLAAGAAGWLTVRRNHDYRSDVAIWRDTAAKEPGNARARNNFGLALLWLPGRLPEAMAECQAALRLKPGYAEAHNNLGLALAQVPGRMPEAVVQFEAALRIKPDDAEMHSNLGNALAELPSRLPDAVAEFKTALRLKPDNAVVHDNLGIALAGLPGRLPEAISEYQAALRLSPDYARAHYNLANALARVPGRSAEAMVEYETALRVKPDFAEAHCGLGMILSQLPGRRLDAIAHYEAALQLKPDLKEARQALDLLQANQ